MRNRNRLWTLLSAATVTCAAGAALLPGSTTARLTPVAHPQFALGPAAVVSNQAASNSYLLFKCQVGLEPGRNCYDPYEMRHAYGTDALINAGWDGTGKTIVIVDAFQNPNIALELSVFDSWYGMPDPPNFTQIAPQGLTPFDSGNADMVGWAVEISLDVEWAHAIAPGANIVLVLAKSDQDADIYAATKYAVDDHLGDIISQSFGENEACMDPNLLPLQHQMFAEATQKRMTVFASAGDDGAGQLTCDGSALVQAVSTPAIDPLVTAVGGTQLNAADYSYLITGSGPPAGTYESETVWNEQPGFGSGGGGFSLLHSEPSYQEGTIHGGKQRGLPDVSYNAAVLHGVLTFIDVPPKLPGGFYLVGGTSAGSPQWSAIAAIADQKNGADLGFINKALYHIGQAPPHFAASFHDITVGNNGFDGVPGFIALPRWDAASGSGSPKAPELVDLLIQRVSPGDGESAIAQSPVKTNNSGNGRVKPH